MNRSKMITAVTVPIMVGVIIGLVIASNFNFMVQSTASESGLPATTTRTAAAESKDVTLDDLQKTSRTFVEVVKQASPAVVMITSTQNVKVRNPWAEFFGEEFGRRFGQPDQEQSYERQGLGSGVIVSSDGYILTNNHVVENADELKVLLDGEELDAKVVGTDPKTDVAVVKVQKTNLPFIRQGDSDQLQVGEIVLAIGSPFDRALENTVTQGIVSAKGRKNLQIGGEQGQLYYQDFIQTDAAINPGNSGGALVSLRGELVGINTAIIGQANVGIGFAIPINLAKWVMNEIITEGHVTRGYLGVVIGPVDKKMARAFGLQEARGALVQSVQEDTPAQKAGVEEGDIIIEFDGKPIVNHNELTNMVAQYKPGTTVSVKIMRKGTPKTLSLKLMPRPEDPTVASHAEKKAVENVLGLTVQDLTDEMRGRLEYKENYGVVVTGVKGNSLAAKQGLQRGDLILEFGVEREKIKNSDQFYEIIDNAKPGDVLLFRYKNRQGAYFVTFEIPEK